VFSVGWLLVGWLTAAGAAPAAPAGSTSAPALLRPILRDQGLDWALDPELNWVAERGARARLGGPRARRSAENSDLGPSLDRLLRQRGLGDPWLLPVVLSGQGAHGPTSTRARQKLWQIVDRVAARHAVTHVGAGWARAPAGAEGGWALVLLFTRRPVDWNPPVETGTTVRIGGRVAQPATGAGPLEVLTLGPCSGPLRCAHPGTRRTLPGSGPSLAVTLERPSEPGRWVVEVVRPGRADDPVLGLWFFDRGDPVPSFRPRRGDPGRWLDELRARARLPELTRDLALTAAAERQARAACAQARATHDDAGADPADRARAEGHRGPVTENVAVAGSPARAFENLLWSPSHRQAMLDPDARQVGVAVARSEGRVCVVQVFGYE